MGRESPRLHEIVLSRASLLDSVYLIGSEWDGVMPKSDVIRWVWTDADRFISEFYF